MSSSSATYKVTIRTDQVNDEGKSAVRIRITKDRKTAYYHTGIFLKLSKDARKSEWNPKATTEKRNWVASKHFDSGSLNTRIKTILEGLQAIETKHPAYTSAQIRDAYAQPEAAKKTGFIAFSEEWIIRKRNHGQYGTASTYITQMGYFKRFWGDRPDDPAKLTPYIISELVHFLRTCDTRRGKGYDAKTINDAFGVYRSFFRNAVLEGWIPPAPNPFSIPLVEEVLKQVERPNVDQIYSLIKLEGLTPDLVHTRNLFLMQFFLHGARVSEVYTLKWSNVNSTHIIFKPRKRAKEVKIIPRHEGIEWILSQYPQQGNYIFPFFAEKHEKAKGEELRLLMRNLNTRIANRLKIIAKMAGLPHLASHMQRHTFADHAWELTKDIRKVQGMLGHSESKTTEGYMTKLGQISKDNLSTSLYSGVQENIRETISGKGYSDELQKEPKE
ncbi:tyrosine-type recombinase/integrase [Pontibacter qinzhouensis]|uniref:Tyrosine-type recombinase/integrase n=1 Tax=Pontibacter qinzhouensis TaxID=2603253 RepID=A0A5C8KF78_9BACT|nr:tyrosine-type recombinase/integrase [Pontibacter qinzhouensis]TXK52335.1 tyrosine-type recombinase/integrase [Pontibacter qinzhouensis]